MSRKRKYCVNNNRLTINKANIMLNYQHTRIHHMKNKKNLLILCLIMFSTKIICENNQISISNDIVIEQLNTNVWIHTSFVEFPKWGRISANGLIVKDKNLVTLIDTPWNNKLTQDLYNWISKNWNTKIDKVIVCHYHEDCMGGLEFLHKQNVKSFSYKLTKEICKDKNLPIPQNGLESKYKINAGSIDVVVYFPGEGHTIDSICTYIPKYKILFGGCSIKALSNKNLGNISEANLKQWSRSLKNMKNTFPDSFIVIPGHGKPGGINLIDHTITLLTNFKK